MPTAAPTTAHNRNCRRRLSAPISTITAPESTQFPAIPAYMSSFTSIPSIFNEIPATQRAGRIGGSIDRSNNRVAACVHLVRLVSVNRLNGHLAQRPFRWLLHPQSHWGLQPAARTHRAALVCPRLVPSHFPGRVASASACARVCLCLTHPAPARGASLAPKRFRYSVPYNTQSVKSL